MCVCVCVCVTNKTLYMQSKESHYITTKNTHQIHQKSNAHIQLSDIQQKHTIQRYVTHIERETKPTPLLEDW